MLKIFRYCYKVILVYQLELRPLRLPEELELLCLSRELPLFLLLFGVRSIPFTRLDRNTIKKIHNDHCVFFPR